MSATMEVLTQYVHARFVAFRMKLHTLQLGQGSTLRGSRLPFPEEMHGRHRRLDQIMR